MLARGQIKPWSISTTVRNPEPLPGFLAVLRDEFEGVVSAFRGGDAGPLTSADEQPARDW